MMTDKEEAAMTDEIKALNEYRSTLMHTTTTPEEMQAALQGVVEMMLDERQGADDRQAVIEERLVALESHPALQAQPLPGAQPAPRSTEVGLHTIARMGETAMPRGSAHVITKARLRNDDVEEVTNYMVGPIRRSAEEAQDDLARFLAPPSTSALREAAVRLIAARDTYLQSGDEEAEEGYRASFAAFRATVAASPPPEPEAPVGWAYVQASGAGGTSLAFYDVEDEHLARHEADGRRVFPLYTTPPTAEGN
jgi:hypothetical protein